MQVILQADQRPQQKHKDAILPAHAQELYLLERELGLILNHKKYSLSDCPVSKKLINLLRHGSLPRENDGAIEFWRIKDYLQNHFVFCHHWSDEKWKSSMAGGGGNKERFQYCTDSSGAILYLRALQGHSGQCRDSGRFLQVHLSRWMCNQFTFRHQFRIDTGRSKFEQQTDSILSACGSYGQRTQGS